MARTLRILVSLVFALGTAAFAIPGAAAAADTAYNSKTQDLTASPTGDMAESCTQRRFQLASGYYDWGQRMGGTKRVNLYLGAGSYTWLDCLYPRDGFYAQGTVLEPDNPEWESISLGGTWDLRSSGTYTWGSYLAPRF